MITGKRTVKRSPAEVIDRLKMAMAGGNYEITAATDTSLSFKHGTYMTESAPLLPKRGVIRVSPAKSGADVSYEIAVAGFPKVWMIIVATVFFWAIFPPILVHRALTYHPRRLMENLLQAI